MAVVALLYASFLVLRTIAIGTAVADYPSLMVAVYSSASLQLLSLGSSANMFEVKHRPIYVIRERIGGPSAEVEPDCGGVPQVSPVARPL